MIDLFYRSVCKVSQVSCCLVSKLFKRKGVVYMLHDISDSTNEFSISEKELEHFLITIKSKNVINLQNWENEKNFIAISIDDVPESFFIKGFPLFIKYSIPFTIFISTDLLDKPGYLSTAQLIELSKSKLCTIGSHGTVHEYYHRLSLPEKISFLQDSKNLLSDICKRNIELFAFPYGSFYACGFTDKRLVQQFYKYGFGTINSCITKNFSGKFFLPRINLNLNIVRNAT